MISSISSFLTIEHKNFKKQKSWTLFFDMTRSIEIKYNQIFMYYTLRIAVYNYNIYLVIFIFNYKTHKSFKKQKSGTLFFNMT